MEVNRLKFEQEFGTISSGEVLRARGTVSCKKWWKFNPFRLKTSLGNALENICWDRKSPNRAVGRN